MTSRLLLLGLLSAFSGAGLAAWTSREAVMEEEDDTHPPAVPPQEVDLPWPPDEPHDAWTPRTGVLRHLPRPQAENERKESFWIAQLNHPEEYWRSVALETLIDMVRQREASTLTLFALHQQFREDPSGKLLGCLLHFPDDASFELLLQTIREQTDEMERVRLLGNLRHLAKDPSWNFLYPISPERGRELTRSRRKIAIRELQILLETIEDTWTERCIRSTIKALEEAG